MNTGPGWATPSGFLFTATENISTSIALVAIGSSLTYSVSVGNLPPGLDLSNNGDITGTPLPVLNKSRYKFIVRASNPSGISDRTFFIDVDGRTTPTFSTANVFISDGNQYLKLGPNQENWALNNQYVHYYITATTTPALTPDNIVLKYFIGDQAGTLPPGLILNDNGLLSGFLVDNLSLTTETSVPKQYEFGVTVTDGAVSTSTIFKILVVDPDIIKNPDEFLPDLDPGVLTTITDYIPPLQFINTSNLGIIRAQNEIILDVSAYDAYPTSGFNSYYLSTGSILPPNLTLDGVNGKVYGYVPYQPAYSQNYSIEINVSKIKRASEIIVDPVDINLENFEFFTTSTTTINTFTFTIKGNVESTIEWISDSDLGDITIGEISELATKAQTLNAEFPINYKLKNGTLPAGLTLAQDGSLSGRVDYAENTGTYTFTVIANDLYKLSEIEKTFTLNVVRYNNKSYTQIYCQPFLTRDKRDIYQRFITDQTIFDQNLIYRNFDSNFGVQSKIKMFIEFGIEELNLEKYATALEENFYKRRYYFGDVKSAIAKDSSGQIAYEIVYVDMIDELINSKGESPPQSFTQNNITYYPGSIKNQQVRFSQITLSPGVTIDINEFMLPRFMRTPQGNIYQLFNYISVVPICYALPNQSNKIISRIKQSGFNFRQFDFEVDRLIIERSLDNSTAKYLIFGKKSLGDE